MNRKPKIISIAAVSGGGKTTITNQLINKLSNSKALYFDNYEFNESPNDICKWVNEGADYNEWILTPLITDVQFLLNSNQPLDYIFLDYPFAYLNNEMREYIDFTIYIDTPLDIAMARRILRDFNENLFDDVRDDLTNYLSLGRTAYLEMIKTVKPDSDIVIDGSLPTILIVNQILEGINKREL
ncbi:hypothetical protein PDN41_17555 [Bacillus cereus]|nr:hypothetical protein [Bacillus cereus]